MPKSWSSGEHLHTPECYQVKETTIDATYPRSRHLLTAGVKPELLASLLLPLACELPAVVAAFRQFRDIHCDPARRRASLGSAVCTLLVPELHPGSSEAFLIQSVERRSAVVYQLQ